MLNPIVIAAPHFSDVDNHWAAAQIRLLTDQGIASGYPDNSFKPDAVVTRAEFVTLVNRAFQLTATAEANYPDVKASDWFAPEIGKARAAGYLGGYTDGTIKPNNNISRQEAAVIIAKAARLGSGNEQDLAKFQDAAAIPYWSRGALAILVSKAYVGGYPDGTIKAQKTISRAEAVVILAKAKAAGTATPAPPAQQVLDLSRLDKAGTYGPEAGNQAISGNVSISVSGVTLQSATISGDLVIEEAVGNGEVTLKNVVVKGTTTIKGGGANTVRFDNCLLNKTIVNKGDGNIRIILSGTTSIAELVADSAVKVEGSAAIAKASINKANVIIETKPGTVNIANGISAKIAGQTVTAAPVAAGGVGGGDGGILPGDTSTPVKLTILASPASGSIVAGGQVTLTPSVAGATVYVTTDGNDPTIFSGVYSEPITVNADMSIKALASLAGYTNSDVTVFAFTVAPQLIYKEGCKMTYFQIFGQTRVRVQTSGLTTGVTANGQNMLKVDDKWQIDLAGDISSVTIVATDGTNQETYILTK